MVERSAVWMAHAVRAREVCAVELFEAHAARIAERDPQVNAVVLPRLEAAREEAVAADAALTRGGAVGALHGVPFTAKDPIAVAGMRAPNGSKLLADRVSERDATLIRRMRGAGAILLGKTNVSEFSAWWDSVNPLFGATANPHDHSRTAGGSSGGEAAAIASGMSPLGLGSDLGGSADGRRRPDGARRRGPRARARHPGRTDLPGRTARALRGLRGGRPPARQP